MCLKKRRRKKEPAWIKASKKWILSLSCLLQTESIPSVPVDFCLQTLCMKLAGSNFFLTYEDFCGRFLITQSLPVPFFPFFFFKVEISSNSRITRISAQWLRKLMCCDRAFPDELCVSSVWSHFLRLRKTMPSKAQVLASINPMSLLSNNVSDTVTIKIKMCFRNVHCQAWTLLFKYTDTRTQNDVFEKNITFSPQNTITRLLSGMKQ